MLYESITARYILRNLEVYPGIYQVIYCAVMYTCNIIHECNGDTRRGWHNSRAADMHFITLDFMLRGIGVVKVDRTAAAAAAAVDAAR